jgi:hypothetical protein
VKTERIWTCKVGGVVGEVPPGADLPMRQAVERAFQEITGLEAEFTFSGWGGTLTEPERAVVEDRLPSQEYEDAWHARHAGLIDATDERRNHSPEGTR